MRKSRARMGVKTECRVRSTGRGECLSSVIKRWDCRDAGREEKCETSEGRDRSVVKEMSGWIGTWGWGDEAPLGGADGHMS